MYSYKKKYKSKTIKGKLRVCHDLRANKELKPLVPQTLPLSPKNLELMTKKRGEFKPPPISSFKKNSIPQLIAGWSIMPEATADATIRMLASDKSNLPIVPFVLAFIDLEQPIPCFMNDLLLRLTAAEGMIRLKNNFFIALSLTAEPEQLLV